MALLQMPNEILCSIFDQLTLRDTEQLKKTCETFESLVEAAVRIQTFTLSDFAALPPDAMIKHLERSNKKEITLQLGASDELDQETGSNIYANLKNTLPLSNLKKIVVTPSKDGDNLHFREVFRELNLESLRFHSCVFENLGVLFDMLENAKSRFVEMRDCKIPRVGFASGEIGGKCEMTGLVMILVNFALRSIGQYAAHLQFDVVQGDGTTKTAFKRRFNPICAIDPKGTVKKFNLPQYVVGITRVGDFKGTEIPTIIITLK